MKLIILLSLCLILSGCSALAPLATSAITGSVAKNITPSANPLVGIDTEIVAGDKTQGVDTGTDTKLDDVTLSDNAQVHTNTVGKNTDIASADNVTLNEGVPFWQAGVLALLCIMLGLFMPQLVIRRK